MAIFWKRKTRSYLFNKRFRYTPSPTPENEDLKEMFLRSLTSERPTHILLWGEVGTAKTLFMQELARLPRSRYALGGSSTKAGIARFLIDSKPLFLLIDERVEGYPPPRQIDKMNSDDYSVLLSLMETGIVSELKVGRIEEVKLNTRVYAACNDVNVIPPELLSRFIKFRIRRYSASEFRKVVLKVLTEREGVEERLAKYISDRLVRLTRDVRCAVQIARMMQNPSRKEIDRIIEIFKKYDAFII